MYCENCSAEIREDSKFCENCGAEINTNQGIKEIEIQEEIENEGNINKKEEANNKQKSTYDSQREIPNQSSKLFGGIHHPWRRFGARSIDSVLIVIAFIPIAVLIIGIFNIDISAINKIWTSSAIATLALYILMAPVEGLLISKFGTTPGKALCGIRVLNKHGENLTYFEAFERTLLILVFAEGFGVIPLVSLVTRIVSYNKLTKTGTTYWDKDKYIVTHKKWDNVRALTVAIILITVFSISIYMEMSKIKP